jgi:hypothetical protein
MVKQMGDAAIHSSVPAVRACRKHTLLTFTFTVHAQLCRYASEPDKPF